jgi:hypothetical protein
VELKCLVFDQLIEKKYPLDGIDFLIELAESFDDRLAQTRKLLRGIDLSQIELAAMRQELPA